MAYSSSCTYGIGSRWHEQNWIGTGKYVNVKGMEDAWKHSPVVFEWYGNYDYLLQRGWSFDSAINFMLRNHVTVINDNVGIVPPDKMPQIEKLSRLVGARFALDEVTHNESVPKGSSLAINMKWTNTGVGKVYKPYVLRFYLLDKDNQVVCSENAKSDPGTWFPGEISFAESFLIPERIKKGSYKLALAVVNKLDNQPSFRLSINVPETNGMYILSNIEVI